LDRATILPISLQSLGLTNYSLKGSLLRDLVVEEVYVFYLIDQNNDAIVMPKPTDGSRLNSPPLSVFSGNPFQAEAKHFSSS
jgi:hypothetical protein